MERRKLGRQGLSVSAIGFGCMSLGIADIYSSSVRNDDEAIALIHRSLDLGVTFLDTANIYGDSEIKVGKALKGRRDRAELATKFGFTEASSSTPRTSGIDGRPESVRKACETSLKRLEVDHIDLYYLHRVDPNVPIEETIGAMAELVRSGKVRYLGLSEAGAATIRRAHKVHPLTAIQTEYSLWSRDPEDEVLPAVQELGIGFVPYSPLGRGFLAGRFKRIEDLAPDDWRHGSPRFQGENFAKNLALVDQVKALARDKGCTPSQLALAWLLARGKDIVPIPGTSSMARLEENAGAVNVRLSPANLAAIEEIAPKGAASGQRYAPSMMEMVNR
ncbi:MAG TPA: aldo/keto reductase [Dongiaceae bacterium]|jgi:aryl-alcohol dehydrogenase-like predicted oxidoreductase|nr:aldo/keto reductase [Dongiaceae bacterium]